MSTQNIQYLRDRLQDAIAARDAHRDHMGDNYDSAYLERLSLLQREVASAKQELERAEAAQVAPVNATMPVAGQSTAIVNLISGGKGDRRVEVAVGTTLSQILRELNWDSTGHVFKRRTGPGQTADLAQGSDYAFMAGEHEIIMVPAVRGGGR